MLRQGSWAIALSVVLCAYAHAQFLWPEGKHAAIVLTYDDALRSQLDVAIPQLNEAKLKGTFFLNATMKPQDMIRWRSVSQNGHELGNHTLFHPCPRAILPDREHYATENYNPQTMISEIAAMNNLLVGLDAGEVHNLSYPCSQTLVGGIDYKDALRHSGLVKYARNGGDQYTSIVNNFSKLDPYDIPSWGPLDHPLSAQLITYVERVRKAGGLGVLQFHGVGGDYLEVSADSHQELLKYLQQNPDIWVGTFQEVMDYVVAHRSTN